MSPFLLTLLVFIGTYVWLATEKTPRYVVVLCSSGILILAGIFTLEEALAQVNWQTITLIFGMFCIVAALSESGFFNWLALSLARRLDYDPIRIFIVFPLLAAALSMALDNITVMLFLATLTLELCAYIPINPVLLISAEVCAANTGGGATLIGAPPNIVMGTTLGYGFNSFLIHMFPTAWFCTLLLIAVYYVMHRKHLRGVKIRRRQELDAIDLGAKILDKNLMRGGLTALTIAVLLLIFHPFVERVFHVPFALGMAALLPALGLMVYEDRHGRDVLRKIDLESLIFFIGLFIIVGALDKAGVFQVLASGLLTHMQNPLAIMLVFLWFAAIMSALVDNIPMALSMAYLIKEMKYIPNAPPEGILVWASLIGLLMGGNMTPIGASPNVIAYGILERQNVKVGWSAWGKLTIAPTLIALIAASILMCVKFKFGWY